jgi:hypothetical protein
MALVVVQRGLALAAVALLGAVGALALVEQREPEPLRPDLPEAVPRPGGGWYEALTAPRLEEARGRRTSCGFIVRARTAGIAHPVLGCGTKLYVAFGSREVLTQVISQRTPSGAQFAVSPALARMLGMQSTEFVRWRFAAAG